MSESSRDVPRIVLASGNQKKIDELKKTLEPLGCELFLQSQWNITEAVENGLSFVENALIKARHASQYTGLPALADDSGLCVDALNGAPGIYSARYSGEQASDQSNNQKLLTTLRNVDADQRGAYFFCALVFVAHASDPTPLIVQARWRGEILEAERGAHGFGYDPLFYLSDHQATAAELDIELKNSISHRALATQSLIPQMRHYLSAS